MHGKCLLCTTCCYSVFDVYSSYCTQNYEVDNEALRYSSLHDQALITSNPTIVTSLMFITKHYLS